MKPHNPSSLDKWMDARVEAYVDGDLPEDQHARFERLLQAHPHWQDQVHYAQRIRAELQALPHEACPPQVTDAVLGHTRQQTNGAAPSGWWNGLWRELDIQVHTGWKPALAFATVLLVVVTSSLLSDPQDAAGLLDQPVAMTHSYSASEIEAAEAEAKWAIAYIAQVGQTTGSTVERAVFEEHMAAPIRRALRPLSDHDRPPQPSNR